MENLRNEIFEIAEKYALPSRHTDFQIEQFIIGKETSIYGKFWQCIREITTRRDTILNYERELIEIDDNLEIEKINLQLMENKNCFSKNINIQELKKKKLGILISRQNRKISKIEDNKKIIINRISDTLSETKKFIEIFNRLLSTCEYKDINDHEAQMEYWNKKFGMELNLGAMFGQPANLELIKSVLALPDNSPVQKQMQKVLENISKKMIGTNT